MSYYAEYDTVKTKMRVPDDSLKDELMIYIQEVEEVINNRLRQRLGSRDVKGRDITLPLTTSTVPAIDEELKTIAHDMVEGKFRLKTSEKDLLWNTAIKNLENYIFANSDYNEQVRKVNDANERYLTLKGLVNALELKKDMLVQLNANRRAETKLYN